MSKVEAGTIIDFMKCRNKKDFAKRYRLIDGYSWTESFVFRSTGEALFMLCDGTVYTGIWFTTPEELIAIFEE